MAVWRFSFLFYLMRCFFLLLSACKGVAGRERRPWCPEVTRTLSVFSHLMRSMVRVCGYKKNTREPFVCILRPRGGVMWRRKETCQPFLYPCGFLISPPPPARVGQVLRFPFFVRCKKPPGHLHAALPSVFFFKGPLQAGRRPDSSCRPERWRRRSRKSRPPPWSQGARGGEARLC